MIAGKPRLRRARGYRCSRLPPGFSWYRRQQKHGASPAYELLADARRLMVAEEIEAQGIENEFAYQ